MLYLCKNYQEFNERPIKCIKIGFTSNLKSRNNSYRTANGTKGFTQLGTKEGTKIFESMFHLRFRDKLLINEDTGRRSEWCKWDQSIIDSFFTESEESLGKHLWDNRETYLVPFLAPRGRAEKVYKYLESKYLTNVVVDFIDSGKLPKYHECKNYLSGKNKSYRLPEEVLYSLTALQLSRLVFLINEEN